MTDTQLKAKNNITLKGSAEIVMEYLSKFLFLIEGFFNLFCSHAWTFGDYLC